MADELAYPASTCSSPSPASFFSTAGHYQELDFVSSEVLEQWLGSEDCLDGTVWDDDGLSNGQPPVPAPKKRGRKPGPRTNGPPISHMEAERQHRDRLNRRSCELHAAVTTVSRMDKVSLLADAVAYISELHDSVK
ncbi:hypothetical protein BAE44_0009631 [Dichanthelium oligosanthes]|uniref:Transcription factor n=1 Tax=Dichanthelium oligosanthes TaxID=888268 RepID=A0A1E5VW62_9POAL|nr:hypothetical protein BAE44_0009631 [Dichanthelium oligosanthes]